MACCLTAPSYYLCDLGFSVIRFCYIPLRAMSLWVPKLLFCRKNLKTIHSKLPSNLRGQWVNTLSPRQNGHRFADDTFKRIFLNENVWILIKNSLKFVPKGPINNIPALVQIMAWRRSGNKPLSEPMMVSLPTHIWVTQPQWVKQNTWLTSGGHFCLYRDNYLVIMVYLCQG